ncbi:hypothetical protein ACFL5Z_13710, partial [Planctomycetota bacterium]
MDGHPLQYPALRTGVVRYAEAVCIDLAVGGAAVAKCGESARDVIAVNNGQPCAGAAIGDAIFDFDLRRDVVSALSEHDPAAGLNRRGNCREVAIRIHKDGLR